MLCDLLTATGCAGVVQSYFRRLSIDRWISRFGLTVSRDDPDFGRAYYAAALARGTDASGTFGLRMMWDNVPELSAWLDDLFPGLADDRSRFEHAFGPPRFIHLTRKDRVAQAVSRLRAEQGGLWHRNADGSDRERNAASQALDYDGAALSRFILEAETSDRHWQGWFDANGIVPVGIVYEDLAADPERAMARLLIGLGRDPEKAKGLTPVTAKLADAESEDWATRYRAEQIGPAPRQV